ncbi:guanylate kinase [Kordiimonas sediminis]|uniref:Guanylate kinase n=1 Tax=Kordiimonas sediminis TaxID=1735581 RepID=A0A919AVR8_9PROT|nr:guanylate kinase [Kordiimonas sediminis]GHF27624.1 guanylate kinase [Kordiimonas sediminis]
MTTKSVSSRRGLMLVMSSPSGAGKTTLSRRLLESDSSVVMSVSATTREPRPGEENGKDYFFVTHERFREMIDHGELLEHAVVFENRYGTPRGPVMQALNEGKDVLFDIDWQGTQQLAESAGDDLVRVFILPPSVAELENRLRKRAQDPENVVQKRMAEAESEISHWAEYDYVLVNDDLEDTFERLQVIIKAERERRRRRPGLSEFVRKLMDERPKNK